jgi:hypothetical protein
LSRLVENPVETPDPFTPGGDSITVTHPAYAQIRASRVSGNAVLYGSDFIHQHYVTVSICNSTLRRHLSKDWAHGDEEYIEVALSEAQWAAFVSSMNVGSGTQCTLQRHNRKMVPGLPAPVDRSAQFAGELGENMKQALEEIHALRSELGDAKIPAKTTKAILSRLNRIECEIGSSSKFVADQFDKHMERTVEKAKIEVNAYATNTITRLGLDAISKESPIGLEYADTKKLERD